MRRQEGRAQALPLEGQRARIPRTHICITSMTRARKYKNGCGWLSEPVKDKAPLKCHELLGRAKQGADIRTPNAAREPVSYNNCCCVILPCGCEIWHSCGEILAVFAG